MIADVVYILQLILISSPINVGVSSAQTVLAWAAFSSPEGSVTY